MNPESIKVTVLFFGAAADLTACRKKEMNFERDTRAAAAVENIFDLYPELRTAFKSSLLFALNQEYSNGDEILSEGDELAFIPPVSGG